MSLMMWSSHATIMPEQLGMSITQMLACSPIDSRLDYCNSLLYGASEATFNKEHKTMQRVQS